ncbi:hypothetical protein BDN72DRAFT_904626 [Pluteus cervinus]|uniref:Uncharacterized protein n=1 Tax=Pluteus cervinus TaxID=181527 RepID=A0ACD3A5A1_9AGAR|nr:hypothetical protein BDN72DRAFT_904626 [Pluteus cervinus]
MQETGALIVGTTAFHFFNRSLNSCAPLELLVDEDDVELFVQWLRNEDFVPFFKNEADVTFSDAFVDDPVEYAHHVMDLIKDDKQVIRLLSTTTNALEVVLVLRTTSAMNYISAWGARALYAHSTFDKKQTLRIYNSVVDNSLASADFFARKGFAVLNTLPVSARIDTPSDFCTSERRFLGDGKCWTLSWSEDFSDTGSAAWFLVQRSGRPLIRVD